ncbi:hypothetical protein [Streptomyces sp. CB01881]|uniref:hypothetical protein n=1 Tax=Streptomyces sp. CB01881 TaxID=2078691 RepID=UPI000CDC2AAB|nr:hypothetical protein [Streptomyces sp. CB01881]AUY52533.1 hypothetical protein C2142_30520 [Streptomyces sp. CB01881]TYC70250.1 hypothetical protein EH183_30585 [Streptomyces sp. CB01881]
MAPKPISRGCAIGLIGIDGVGKTTLAGELERRLTERGVPAVLLSRRQYLKTRPHDFVGDTMATLYEGSLRTLYGFAGLAGGGTLGDHFPPPAGPVMSADFERLLDGAAITGNDPHALITSMLCEIAGHLAFREAVVAPAVRAGKVVIEDTHGIKMVVKLYLLATSLAGSGDLSNQSLEAVLKAGITALRPDPAASVPVLVQVDPEIAYQRRVAQHGRVGGMEHYGPVGRAVGHDSYVELQSRSQKIFDEIGTLWGCLRVELPPQDREGGLRTAVDQILAAVDGLAEGQ